VRGVGRVAAHRGRHGLEFLGGGGEGFGVGGDGLDRGAQVAEQLVDGVAHAADRVVAAHGDVCGEVACCGGGEGGAQRVDLRRELRSRGTLTLLRRIGELLGANPVGDQRPRRHRTDVDAVGVSDRRGVQLHDLVADVDLCAVRQETVGIAEQPTLVRGLLVEDVDRPTDDLVGAARQQVLDAAQRPQRRRVHVPDHQIGVAEHRVGRRVLDHRSDPLGLGLELVHVGDGPQHAHTDGHEQTERRECRHGDQQLRGRCRTRGVVDDLRAHLVHRGGELLVEHDGELVEVGDPLLVGGASALRFGVTGRREVVERCCGIDRRGAVALDDGAHRRERVGDAWVDVERGRFVDDVEEHLRRAGDLVRQRRGSVGSEDVPERRAVHEGAERVVVLVGVLHERRHLRHVVATLEGRALADGAEERHPGQQGAAGHDRCAEAQERRTRQRRHGATSVRILKVV
jgi:hypothetical protein